MGLLTTKSPSPQRGGYVPWGAYLLKKLTIFSEWQNLYKGLPQHMLDKYVNPNYQGIDDWATSNKVLTDGKAAAGKRP